MTLTRSIINVLMVATLLLIIPLIGSQFVDGWNWSGSDFVFAWLMVAVMGTLYVAISRKSPNMSYKLGLAAAVATAFLLIWVDGAVGIIGDGGPFSQFYFMILVLAFIGVLISRFKAAGMSRTAFTTAILIMAVPTVGVMVNPGALSYMPGVLGVFVLNAVFAGGFVVSGLLFRKAGKKI